MVHAGRNTVTDSSGFPDDPHTLFVNTCKSHTEGEDIAPYERRKSANNVLQKTNTAVASFSIRLSHNGLVPRQGSLPVVRGGVGF